jgi:hypothetical protein
MMRHTTLSKKMENNSRLPRICQDEKKNEIPLLFIFVLFHLFQGEGPS